MKIFQECLLYLVALLGVFQLAATSSTDNFERKKALIFGVTGQDGIYLSSFLLEKGYDVYGVRRKFVPSNTAVIQSYEELQKHPNFFLHWGNLTNYDDISSLIEIIQPDEIYNLAAQSHVKTSFELPIDSAEINALGTVRILEAIRCFAPKKKIKFYQASSSEIYGLAKEAPQTEETPFYPRSPYGIAKLYSYWITVNYREAYGIFACNGILYNHESPLRDETYVTRKITLAASRYKLGIGSILQLGNLDGRRDWGYAKDYIEAMWLMLQQDTSQDYVIATGETHSVRECVEMVFRQLGIEIEWHGQGVSEYGTDRATGEAIVKVNPLYYRPIEGDYLVGNSEKAQRLLQWKPRTTFSELLAIMIEFDYQKVMQEMVSVQK